MYIRSCARTTPRYVGFGREGAMELPSPSDWMKAGRVDLSDWVIHFVHARRLEDYPAPFSWPGSTSLEHGGELTEEELNRVAAQCEAENAAHIPCSFGEKGPEYWDLDWSDEEYPVGARCLPNHRSHQDFAGRLPSCWMVIQER